MKKLGLSILLGVCASFAQSKALLDSSDFKFMGCFRLPKSLSQGGEIQFASGLTHRYVGDELRLLSAARMGPTYEFTLPDNLSQDLSKSPNATEKGYWSGLSKGNAYADGLFWDEVDERLYFAGGVLYNATNGHDPSLGFADKNKVVQGAWAFGDPADGTERSSKALQGGALHIPKWFSDQYCPGKRLGAGFGGYYSVISTGPVSMGPALTAFNPADMGKEPYVSQSQKGVPHTPLVGYDGRNRCHRNPDYNSEYDGGDYNPEDGVGYWTWSDVIFQGGEWIDTENKTGLIFFATLGNGRLWYGDGDRQAEKGSHALYLYDPADLASVATGKKKQHEIQPKREWVWQFPGMKYPMNEFGTTPDKQVTGVTFDRKTNRMYVAVVFPRSGVENWLDNTPAVFVYEFNDEVLNVKPKLPARDGGRMLRIRPESAAPGTYRISLQAAEAEAAAVAREQDRVWVTNSKGEKVVDLTGEFQDGEARWSASALPVGAYWVTARIQGRTETLSIPHLR